MNPLIDGTFRETAHNVAEAMNALLVLLSHSDNDLCRLMMPIAAAIDHLAESE